MELFFDLVFVVAVAELADKLDNDTSVKGALQFTALFVIVWWSWAGAAFYATSFDTDDTVHRLLTAVQMFAVAAMAVNIHRGLESSSAGFALASHSASGGYTSIVSEVRPSEAQSDTGGL